MACPRRETGERVEPNSYLSGSLPHFLYFDDYKLLESKLNLESLNQRKTNNQLTNADKTALGLFELAGIDLKELMSEEDYENSKAKLEAIGLTITHQVFEYWTQNKELAVEFDIKTDPTRSRAPGSAATPHPRRNYPHTPHE